MPATLAGAVFALRRVELRFRSPRPRRHLSSRRSRAACRSRRLEPTLRAQPAAGLARRVRPLVLEQIDRPLLRECLEALYRASGAATPDDLALVGVYDRVPVGAIAGAAATPHGLELRLRRRQRAHGAVCSWSDAAARAGRSSPPRCRDRRSLPNRRTLSICQPRTLKFRRAHADAEHKEAPGNAGVPRT